MDGLNLLPEQFRRRRGAQFVPISIVATIGIAVVSVLLMELAVVSRMGKGSGSVLDQTLADRRVDLQLTRQRHEAVEAEAETLAGVLPHTPVWSNVLIEAAQAVGPRVWFQHWSSDAERGLCTIQGYAVSNGDVFELVAALEALPHFTSVALAGVSRKDGTSDDEETGEVQFEIVCRLRQTAR